MEGGVGIAPVAFSNALIERKGAPTGLITTAGFADVLEIGRERKYELYDLFLEMPENESTFVVGPSSTATVLPDGSILSSCQFAALK
jgi:N-methylhydantoinase A